MFHRLMTVKCKLACFINLTTTTYELYISPILKGEIIIIIIIIKNEKIRVTLCENVAGALYI